ncbi:MULTISPECIES: hypothetical protein [unclassified Methylobacterium]|uniref:hypothetical protein n=1 Tax=unclassified Methylobacterium TaxID=2615210 RepID=UPI0011CB9CB4|nr:hypothetical protein [Methylobacterium sp. WL64]TXN01353.1 hypothetical protein FV242_18790 [Methylobacterium sp. WL64]
MCDDSKPSGTPNRIEPHGSSLGEIARVLGVPVSSFFASAPDAGTPGAHEDPAAAALLDLVRCYLLRASPEARRYFVARLRVMLDPASP